MSLLTICTNVANDLALSAPTSIVGNTDETAIRLLAQAQRAGQSLAKKPPYGWLAMQREYTFTTSAIANQNGSIANTGPGGVAVISGLTTTAGMAASTWYAFGSGVPNNAIVSAVTPTTVTINQPTVTPGAGQFSFGKSDYALPADFQRPIDGSLWDRSRYWQMRGPMSPQEWQLFKSSLIGKASIQRRYRFRRIAGNNVFSIDPVPTDNGAIMVFEYVSNAWCESQSLVPQTAWAADTDIGILDEDLIELGTRWRMLRRLGMSYSEELDEYEREVSKAMAHDGGAAVLSLVREYNGPALLSWANIPETGYGGITGS